MRAVLLLLLLASLGLGCCLLLPRRACRPCLLAPYRCLLRCLLLALPCNKAVQAPQPGGREALATGRAHLAGVLRGAKAGQLR